MILVTVILFLFLAQCPRSSHCRPHDSLLFALCLHLAEFEQHSGESSLPGRAGFRHGGGWRGGDGRKHRAPHEPLSEWWGERRPGRVLSPAHYHEPENTRGDHPRGGPRSPTPGVLCHRHHHYRLFADFHITTRGGQIIPAHGLDGGFCASRRHDLFDSRRSGSGQHFLPQRSRGNGATR